MTLDKDLTRQPDVQMPEGEPPPRLVVQDVVEGGGETVQAGDRLTVHYVGVSWERREIFDSSWEGEPTTLSLDEVVEGWRQGLVGMRVGGRRGLVIPPDLGYDDGDTMVFVVDLHAIERGPAPTTDP